MEEHNRRRKSKSHEDSDRTSKKQKIMDEPASYGNLDLDKIHQHISNEGRQAFGRPFTFRLSNQVFSCCAWSILADDLLSHLKACESEPKIYCLPALVVQKQEKNMTCYIFNMGLKHHPLRSFVDNLYGSSSSYGSIDNMSRMNKPSKHSLLTLLKVCRGAMDWISAYEKSCTQISYGTDFVVKRMMNNLWVMNGNCENDIKKPIELRASPVFRDKDVGITSGMSVALSFCRTLFKLDWVSGIDGAVDNYIGVLGPLRKFFSTLTTKGSVFKNLDELKLITDDAIQWFFDHSYWPEISWKSEGNDPIWSFVPERCLTVYGSSDDLVAELDLRFKLTGTAIYDGGKITCKNATELFAIKPLLIDMSWDYANGMYLKIVVNQLSALFKPMSKTLEYIYKKDVRDESVSSIAEMKSVIRDFTVKLSHLHASGRAWTKGSLLSCVYFCGHTIKGMDMCLYGQDTDVSKRTSGGYEFSKQKVPSGIADLLELAEYSSSDPIENNLWEYGCWLVQIYQSFTGCSIATAVSDYLMRGLSRIVLREFACGDSFLLLIGYIMTRNTARPSLNDVLESKFFRYWYESDDIVKTFVDQVRDARFCEKQKTEINNMNRLTDNNNESCWKTVRLKTEWQDFAVPNCMAIVKEFSRSVSKMDFSMVQRNRRDMKIKFTTLKVGDLGVGKGVESSAMYMFSCASNTLGLFKRNVDTISRDFSYWFTLGCLMNHSVLSGIRMNLEVPPSLLKIAIYGPENVMFGLTDLLLEQPDVATILMNLYYCTDEELKEMELYMDDIHPLVSGAVNIGNLHLYIGRMIRQHLFKDYNMRLLGELHAGYMLTPPETRPTPKMLRKLVSMTVLDASSKQSILQSLVLGDHSDYKEHNNRCFTQNLEDEYMCSAGYPFCPLKIIGKFLMNCDVDLLRKFVKFVTGAPFSHEDKAINVLLQRSAGPRLPSARTCFRTLTVPVCDEDDENSIENRIIYAIEHTFSFGFE